MVGNAHVREPNGGRMGGIFCYGAVGVAATYGVAV